MTKSETNPKRDWIDLAFKATTTILSGLLIALAGFIANMVLTSVSGKQESARLITELQIKREEADIMLRKDVFDKALEAFLLTKQDSEGTLRDMSKQLLRLELLALNFGDSLSLSPIFVEFRNDLDKLKPVNDEETHEYKWRRAELKKRLESLAKRVASSQISSLEQHGKTIKIEIPFDGIEADNLCIKPLFGDSGFTWPNHDALKQLNLKSFETLTEEGKSAVNNFIRDSSSIELNGVMRHLELGINNVDLCKKTAEIQLVVYKTDRARPEVDRQFRLDYFNFPMVDNTRLSDNQRLAVIMDDFNTSSNEDENPGIKIICVIFPSEYASLRDRPGMQEARRLLEAALKDKKNDNDN